MPNTTHVCLYADRHGCGNREAHPYIASGGPVCDLHKPGATAAATDARIKNNSYSTNGTKV